MSPTVEVKYELVVQTNSYAGNFEREMTAFATGVLGECGVGDGALESFFDAASAFGYEGIPDSWSADEPTSPFEGLMEQVDDGEGCQRPTTMSRNDAGKHHNVTMFMYQKPSDRDLAFIAQQIRAYPEFSASASSKWGPKDLQVLGIKLNRIETSTVTEVLVEL